MIINYLKIAFRNLRHHRMFAFINVLGLSLCMAVGVVLLNEIKQVFDYDTFHPDDQRVVRIISTATNNLERTSWATSPKPLAETLRQLPGVDQTVTVRTPLQPYSVITEKGNIDTRIAFTQPAFFEFFGFKLKMGNAPKALSSPKGVLITEKMATAIFGAKSPVGQPLTFESLGTFTVMGIIKTPPFPSHIHLGGLFSEQAEAALVKQSKLPDLDRNWQDFQSVAVYAHLNQNVTLGQLNNQLAVAAKKLPQLPEVKNAAYQFQAQTIADITPWNPAIRNDFSAGMNWKGIWTVIFLIVALTLLASFNYVNLTLVRSLTRAKEVGVRKATGAKRVQIFQQFLVESCLITFLALVLTFPLLETARFQSWFTIHSETLSFNFNHWKLWIWLVAYFLFTALISGALPAWLLSSFQPIQVLRRLQNIQLLGQGKLYKALTLLQFSAATMFMIFLVVFKDAVFRTNQMDWGISTDNVVIVDTKGKPTEQLKAKMVQIAQVESITVSETPINYSSGACRISSKQKGEALQSNYYAMDEGAAEVFKVSFIAGDNFPKNLSANTEQYVLVNEAIAKYISPKTPTAAVGKPLWIDDTTMVQIAGVLKNFRPMGPQIPASRPLMVRYLPKVFHTLAIRVKPGNEQAVLKATKSVWSQSYPEINPNIYIYDERNADSADHIISLFEFWGTLVIVVACLGLFGMVAYALEIRTKELGIRRVLGAQHGELMWLISKSFVRILIWAGFIGIPFGAGAGFLLQQRMGEAVDLGVVNLSKGFVFVLLIGIVTVLLQVWQVRNVKSVESLKME